MKKFDLDCGITVWYYRPSFIARVCNVLFSGIIAIYLFNCCVLLSDEIYKVAVSKFPLALCAVLAISIIVSAFTFIMMIFKLFPENQFWVSMAAVGSSLIYLALCLAFMFACSTEAAFSSAQFAMEKYLKSNINQTNVQEFLTRINSNYTQSQKIDLPIKQFITARTTGIGSPLFGLSFVWTLISLYIYYYFLYTGSASKLIQNQEPERKDIEERLTKNAHINI